MRENNDNKRKRRQKQVHITSEFQSKPKLLKIPNILSRGLKLYRDFSTERNVFIE